MKHTMVDQMAAQMQESVLENEAVQQRLRGIPYAPGTSPWDARPWHELPESVQAEIQTLDQETPWCHPGLTDDEDRLDRIEAAAEVEAAAGRTQWFQDPMTGYVKSMIQQMQLEASNQAAGATPAEAVTHVTVWQTLGQVLELFDQSMYQA